MPIRPAELSWRPGAPTLTVKVSRNAGAAGRATISSVRVSAPGVAILTLQRPGVSLWNAKGAPTVTILM